MCMGGGNKAASEANRQEQQRTAKITAAQAKINSVFDDPNRAAEIQQVVSAVRQNQLDSLNQQKADNARQLKFSLARNGQVGSSVQADLNADQKRAYDQGVISVEQNSQGVGANLSAADQDSRARLISLASSGLDATTGAAQSAAALRSNLASARSNGLSTGLADSFTQFKDQFSRMRDDYQRRKGLRDSGVSPYGTVT